MTDNKKVVTIISENDLTKIINNIDFTKPNFQSYLDIAQLKEMITGPIDLNELVAYLNYMNNPHGIYFAVGPEGDAIRVVGRNISECFDLVDNKLISNTSSVNGTSINQTNQILSELDSRGIGTVTVFSNKWQKVYFHTKQSGFVTMSFYGSIGMIKTTGVQALTSSTGAAPITIPVILSVSFLAGLTLNLITNITPAGKVKEGLKWTSKFVAIPIGIAQWCYNKAFGILEKPFKPLLGDKSYDVNITKPTGLLAAPEDLTFNETMKNLQKWTKAGLVVTSQFD